MNMRLQALLDEMDSVEDLFDSLGVPYDPHVVATHRMRILRRFGREVEAVRISTDEAETRKDLAEILGNIHAQCARGVREPAAVFGGITQQLVQLRRGPPKPSD